MLVIFGIVGRIALRNTWWPVEVKMVSWRVEIVDNVVNEGPKIAWVVKPCIEELTAVGCQVDDTDLGKKDVKNVKIPGLVWVKEAVGRKSGMPVIESDSEIAEAMSETVVGDEILSVLDDSIDKVMEAANPCELQLPAIGDSARVGTSCGYKSLKLGVAFKHFSDPLWPFS